MAESDALRYVEDLILRLLKMLTAKPVPTSVADIEERVRKRYEIRIGINLFCPDFRCRKHFRIP